jgi:glycosyltransferase involved in cell wall biosynthesis
VVLSRRLRAVLPEAANIRYYSHYLEDGQLAELQNAHLFHLCTSETEGWGHYIPEALSTGAVVIATDAPPMNELVGEDRGLLVAAREKGHQHLAMTYEFDEGALERTVALVLAQDASQYLALGVAARAWFLANQQGFPERLRQALAASGVQAA